MSEIKQRLSDRLKEYMNAVDYISGYMAIGSANSLKYSGPVLTHDDTLKLCERAESGEATIEELVERLEEYIKAITQVDGIIGFVSVKYGTKYTGPQVLTDETRVLIDEAKSFTVIN